MKGLVISHAIEDKLASKHNVTRKEVEQCFQNCEGKHLLDTREEHQTDPATRWFVAETNAGRKLKIVFVFDNEEIFMKTAYDANTEEIRIYEKYAL